MAHAGMGMPFVITNQGEAEVTAQKFRKYIQNPVLTHIAISYEKFDAYDVEPLSVPDVFSERPVLIFGKYRGSPSGSIVLKGMNGEGKYETSLPVSTVKVSEDNVALRYLWARERIRTLSDYASTGYGGNDEYKPEIIELGLKYNLLTSYTSFIAIDNDIRNKNGNSTTVNQPLPLPEGVSDMAVSGVVVTALGISRDKKSLGYATQQQENLTVSSYEVSKLESKDIETEDSENTFILVESMPEFTGGQKALDAFLVSNLRYPQSAKEMCIMGKVYVSFLIDKAGNVTNVKVLRGIGCGCDEEAVRVIKLTSGKWKPGKQNGKPVKVTMTIPIQF
jgi:Ca-activated chloride channel family protein